MRGKRPAQRSSCSNVSCSEERLRLTGKACSRALANYTQFHFALFCPRNYVCSMKETVLTVVQHKLCHCKCQAWEFYLPVLGNVRITTFQLALPKSSFLKQ